MRDSCVIRETYVRALSVNLLPAIPRCLLVPPGRDTSVDLGTVFEICRASEPHLYRIRPIRSSRFVAATHDGRIIYGATVADGAYEEEIEIVRSAGSDEFEFRLPRRRFVGPHRRGYSLLSRRLVCITDPVELPHGLSMPTWRLMTVALDSSSDR